MHLVQIIRAGERIRDRDVCTLRLRRPRAYIRSLADDVAAGADVERAADAGAELRGAGSHVPAPAVTGVWLGDEGVQGGGEGGGAVPEGGADGAVLDG
ncbi:hypothetical protein V500_04793, partial [Pseudogymnoascus sp. VKM F-4518 (FW-2643)]